jgi:2-dehydropantoate 2-reductase
MTGPRVLVLGAGGVGGYFGGRLAEAGGDVTFLVRGPRADQLRRDGLRIESQFGAARITPQVVTADAPGGGYDVVILGCKAYDLAAAIDSVRPAVGATTAILPVLNGVAHLDALNAAFGRDRILGGTAKIQATLSPDNVIRHLNDWRFLTLGEQDGRMSDRVAAFAAAFAPARGVSVEAVPDILQRMWEKLVHVATSASITCLMRANVGEIARTERGCELMLRLLEANAEIARRNGHPPSDAFMAAYSAVFTDVASQYSTSMLRDIERGGPVEGEHIVGHMARQAAALGLDEPILALALSHLQAYEQRRAAGRL